MEYYNAYHLIQPTSIPDALCTSMGLQRKENSAPKFEPPERILSNFP